MTFALAHFSDGHARLVRFLADAMPGPEMAADYERAILAKVEAVKKAVRETVASRIRSLNTKQVQESLEKLVASANPEHIRQRLEEIIDLTGSRAARELIERITRIRTSAASVISDVHAGARQEGENLRRAVTESRAKLDEAFALADGILGEHRSLVEAILTGANSQALRDGLVGELKKLRDLVGRVSLRTWLDGAIPQLEELLLSPRLLALLDDLAAAILEAGHLPEDGLKRMREFREKVERLLVGEFHGAKEFTSNRFKDLATELQRLSGDSETELKDRLDAMVALANAESVQWIDRLDYLFLGLAAVPKELEANLKTVLDKALGPLTTSKLKEMLGPAWDRVQGARNELRGYVGDAQDLKKAVEKLAGEAKERADTILTDLRQQLGSIESQLRADLQERAKNVEGEVFGFVKRALVSLPSSALLDDFSDQTGKAVFTAAKLTQSAGQDLCSLMAFPKIESVSIRLPGIQELQVISHTQAYLEKGLRDFGAAPGQVFAEVRNAVQAAGEAAGIGAATTQIQSLSREAGALSQKAATEIMKYGERAAHTAKVWAEGNIKSVEKDLEALRTDVNAKLDAAAKALLGNPPPKLFNEIDLAKVLDVIRDPGEIPKAVAKEFPDRVEHVLAIRKEANPVPDGLLQFMPLKDTELKLESRTTAWLPMRGKPNRGVTNTVRGQLGPFQLVIGSVIGLHFQSLSFVGENGSFKCHPKLGKGSNGDLLGSIEFLGPLAFLQDVVRTFAGFLTGKAPFRLMFDGETIFAGIQIALPTIGFGAFTMENLALGMAIGLPVSKGRPLVYRFNVSDRIETFKVSVCGFAGGGFFAMAVSSDPNYGSIEAAIEFGGCLALNLGIAQGSLSVMAGLYYRKQGPEVILEAYLRACGVVVILGFVEASIVFYLALQYRKPVLHGEASLTIRVWIGFFSKSFRLKYSKTIGGSDTQVSMLQNEREPGRPREILFASVERVSRVLSDAGGIGLGCDAPDRRAAKQAPSSQTATRFTQRVNPEEWKEYWGQFDHRSTHPCAAANQAPTVAPVAGRRLPNCSQRHTPRPG